MSLNTQLAALETSGLIRRAQMEPELEYLFRHALIQDAAYESLLKADRRILHRAIGETLERLYPERLNEVAAVLGHHFRAAGETERARKCFTLAGDYALAHYANVEAEQHYRAALELGGADLERAPLFAGLGSALYAQARFGEAPQPYLSASRLHQAIGDYDHAARWYARASEALFRSRGDVKGALDLCQEGLSIPSIANQPDSRGLAELLHETGKASYFNGLVAEARPLCEQALHIADRLGLVDVHVSVLATLGILTDQPYEAQIQTLIQAVQLVEAAGVRGLPAWRARNNLASWLSRSGDFHVCLQLQQQILEAARQDGQVGFEIWALTEMMYYHLQLGQWPAVKELSATIRRLTSGVAPLRIASDFHAYEAMLAYYLGDMVEAARLLESALSEARRTSEFESVIWMNCILAEISLENNTVETAVSAAQESLAQIRRVTFAVDLVWALCLLCTASVQQRDWLNAHHLLDEAWVKTGPQPALLSHAHLARAQARLAVAEAQWSEALAAFELTAQLEGQIGRRWYRAQTLREWAEAHLARHESDDVDRAHELLREAQAEFEAMNVPKYAALVRERLEGRSLATDGKPM